MSCQHRILKITGIGFSKKKGSLSNRSPAAGKNKWKQGCSKRNVQLLSELCEAIYYKKVDKVNDAIFLPNMLKVDHLDGKDFRPTI